MHGHRLGARLCGGKKMLQQLSHHQIRSSFGSEQMYKQQLLSPHQTRRSSGREQLPLPFDLLRVKAFYNVSGKTYVFLLDTGYPWGQACTICQRWSAQSCPKLQSYAVCFQTNSCKCGTAQAVSNRAQALQGRDDIELEQKLSLISDGSRFQIRDFQALRKITSLEHKISYLQRLVSMSKKEDVNSLVYRDIVHTLLFGYDH